MIFDTHAHLTSEKLSNEADQLVQRAKDENVLAIMNICTDEASLEKGLILEEKYPSFIYNAASTTPHDVEKEGSSFFPIVKEKALSKKLKAVGETGLDYYYTHSEKKIQKEFFIRYLHLALESNLPVIIHCREAFSDFFEIIDAEYKDKNGRYGPLVLHCFTGTLKEAEEVLKRGFYLSLSGIVTFKNSIELKEVAKLTPLSQLLIETDAPYLAPHPLRSKVNEPAFIKYTASEIALLKNISFETLTQHTTKNAKAFFNL